jgi:hypothetical protein
VTVTERDRARWALVVRAYRAADGVPDVPVAVRRLVPHDAVSGFGELVGEAVGDGYLDWTEDGRVVVTADGAHAVAGAVMPEEIESIRVAVASAFGARAEVAPHTGALAERLNRQLDAVRPSRSSIARSLEVLVDNLVAVDGQPEHPDGDDALRELTDRLSAPPGGGGSQVP